MLERLKNDLATRHMPVCVISTDEARERAFASGALAFVAKPIQSRDVLDGCSITMSEFIARRTRSVLVVEPDAGAPQPIGELLERRGRAGARPSRDGAGGDCSCSRTARSTASSPAPTAATLAGRAWPRRNGNDEAASAACR